MFGNQSEQNYQKALKKYGDQYKSIFAIMPDEVLEKFLHIEYLKGLRELHGKYSDYIIKENNLYKKGDESNMQ
jgi:hypothetical protein